MKNALIVIFFILLLSPLIVTLASLCFMPDLIPMHFNASGMIDRYGSKYEAIIIPIINIIFGAAFYFFIRRTKNQRIELTLYIGAIISMIAFNILTYFIIAHALI